LPSEPNTTASPLSASRRSFLHLSAATSAALALRIITEPMLARAAAFNHPANAVMIDANENPLGPAAAAREALMAMAPQGGRYLDHLTDEFIEAFAKLENLRPENVHAYAGSSEPLHYAVLEFTSPQKSYVTADPGYEAGMEAAHCSGARLVRVALTKDYAHDVRAMLAAAPDAGLFYVCTPNNPTGTLTNHDDVEYLVEHKPAGSVVMVDEAYIHFTEAASCLDLVRAGKDVIVLRTFSKLYGMAGLRCGFAIARPDLLQRLQRRGGGNPMPITAVAAAVASLRDPGLIAERRLINATNRAATFQWLDRNGYKYIPSQASFFLLDARRPARPVIEAMAHEGVCIGRIWPILPTYTRITVGTAAEMGRFQVAWQKVMNGTTTNAISLPQPRRLLRDGKTVLV
jgi:histidinol-phosphate aminotransferase